MRGGVIAPRRVSDVVEVKVENFKSKAPSTPGYRPRCYATKRMFQTGAILLERRNLVDRVCNYHLVYGSNVSYYFPPEASSPPVANLNTTGGGRSLRNRER